MSTDMNLQISQLRKSASDLNEALGQLLKDIETDGRRGPDLGDQGRSSASSSMPVIMNGLVSTSSSALMLTGNGLADGLGGEQSQARSRLALPGTTANTRGHYTEGFDSAPLGTVVTPLKLPGLTIQSVSNGTCSMVRHEGVKHFDGIGLIVGWGGQYSDVTVRLGLTHPCVSVRFAYYCTTDTNKASFYDECDHLIETIDLPQTLEGNGYVPRLMDFSSTYGRRIARIDLTKGTAINSLSVDNFYFVA